jgi:cytochrome c556
MQHLRFLSITVVLALGVAFISHAAAEIKKGKTRPLLTKQLMGGLVKIQCGNVKKILDAGPAGDPEWEEAAMSAALLNEASYILMADDRCPDGEWAKAASMQLRDGSAAILQAIEKKNLDEAREGFKAMTEACANCHKAHRK